MNPSTRVVPGSQRWLRLSVAALGAVLISAVLPGCDSCQPSTPEVPAPVPQQGQLPKPAVQVTPAGTVPIPPPSCAVVASASVEEGVAPLEVQFSAEGMCTDAEGTFTWDFGDGSPVSHEINPTHTYQTAGTFPAKVTLDDPEHDAKDSDEVPITVTAK